MKKKAIEQIPYLGAACSGEETYIGAAAVVPVKGEDHLIVEIYDAREIPIVRIALTKKDFANYHPETGEWSAERIGHITSGLGEIILSDNDAQIISTFCGERGGWTEQIRTLENEIAYEKNRQKYERREKRRIEALKDRIEHTPKLCEEDLIKTAEQISLFGHWLFYKKNGSRARVACTNCGKVTTGRYKPGVSYESQFGLIEEPNRGRRGMCPHCRSFGTYTPQGTGKKGRKQKQYLFLGQKYKDGIVIRYICVQKEWIMRTVWEEKGEIISGAAERTSCEEIARAYFEPGRKVQKDYHKWSPYTGENFWDDCNLTGIASIGIEPGHIMQETYDALKGTVFQYCALKEYAKEKSVNPIIYLERYREAPQLEMLVKTGMIDVAELIVKGFITIKDKNEKRPEVFLDIRKERIKQLQTGDAHLIFKMQIEKRLGQKWTQEQIEAIYEVNLSENELREALRYMSVQKLLNRISKYAKCEYGTGRSFAKDRLHQTKIQYLDYLHMREMLGYDLHNLIQQYPRDLKEAHDRMVEESNERKREIRVKEAERKFPRIRLEHRRLDKKYRYTKGDYSIRSARSAKEIIDEGRILHHCVGGDSYLKKHNDGITFILMLRSCETPEKPYITVEIAEGRDGKVKIIQWYGDKDKKPNKEEMQTWLGHYVRWINGKKEENDGIRTDDVR